MKTATVLFALPVAVSGWATEACSTLSSLSPEGQREFVASLREHSKPVVTDRSCGFVNGGDADAVSAGPAIALQSNRFYQVVEDPSSELTTEVLVVDCNERSVVRLVSKYIQNENYRIGTCGTEHGDRRAIVGDSGVLTLTEGDTLAELAAISAATGEIEVDTELKYFRLDMLGNVLPSKDEVDFLCGCRLLYPNSKGGQ